jgi:hypothetical protein
MAATTQVVSTVIVVERTEEGHALPVQRPVYYISEFLSDTKTRYLSMRNVVPTLTSNKRQGLSLNGRC